jgi:hypothetical protein
MITWRKAWLITSVWAGCGLLWGFSLGRLYEHQRMPSPAQIAQRLLERGLKCSEVPEWRK